MATRTGPWPKTSPLALGVGVEDPGTLVSMAPRSVDWQAVNAMRLANAMTLARILLAVVLHSGR
jgi:hypothetical protein